MNSACIFATAYLIPGIPVSVEELKNDFDDMDSHTTRHVAGGLGHSLSWRWSLLDTILNKAADKAQDEDELVDKSRSEIHCETQVIW